MDGAGAVTGGEEEEESDGLEIVSVGALYKGPWAKKYWSCSRGKDRYPYPVGYHAIRTYSGGKFKLDIVEEAKGPLFKITSTGGEVQCGAGRTPDMAWEHFQRRSGPQVKLLHGKRLSCNVDGPEFFGFRNPLVQRLLRELVANINGPAEQSLRSTDFSGSANGAKLDTQISKPCAAMDLLSCIVEHKTGKRSNRLKIRKRASFDEIPQSQLIHGTGIMNKSEVETQELPQPFPLDERKIPKETPVHENVGKENSALASAEARILSVCISETQVSHNGNVDINACDEKNLTGSSQVEGNTSSDTPNSNSERSNFDAVTQEWAKSMISVLLPRALPLLMKTYKRRKIKHCGREKADTDDNKFDENADVKCQDGKNEQRRPDYLLNDDRVHDMSIGERPSAIPDSIEHDQLFSFDAKNHRCSISDGSKFFFDTDVLEDSLHDVVSNDSSIGGLFREKTINPAGFIDENKSFPSASAGGIKSLSKTSFVNDKLDTFVGINSSSSILPVHLSGYQATQTASIDNRCPLNVSRSKLEDTSEKTLENKLCQEHGENAEGETNFPMKAPLSNVAGSSVSAVRELQRNFFPSQEEVTNVSPALLHHMMMEHSMDTPKVADINKHALLKVKGCFSVEPLSSCMHPAPVISLLLTSKEDCITVCVLCGHLETKERTLFLYKFHIYDISEKAPTFFGYTSIAMPHSRGIHEGEEMAFWCSGLQFTPDGKYLVIINRFQVPRCREYNISCLCFKCMSENSEENAVHVVRIEFGYASLVKSFSMPATVHCILVCEPNYLAVAEDGGGLHVYVMNTEWCDSDEHFKLPSSEWSEPVLQLHALPNCVFLVVGHDWAGSFFLWDLSQRVLLAKYSASQHYIARVLPIGLSANFRFERIEEFITSAEKFFELSTIQCFNPLNIDDVAILLLISFYPENDLGGHSGRTWRLALLAKNKLMMDKTLNLRATTANVLGSKGIFGTDDGFVYTWDLCSGKKLFKLQHEEGILGGGVSHIAVEPRLGVLAVTGEDCELWFYLIH